MNNTHFYLTNLFQSKYQSFNCFQPIKEVIFEHFFYFLRPNTTIWLQLLVRVIIRSFKVYYLKKKLVKSYFSEIIIWMRYVSAPIKESPYLNYKKLENSMWILLKLFYKSGNSTWRKGENNFPKSYCKLWKIKFWKLCFIFHLMKKLILT